MKVFVTAILALLGIIAAVGWSPLWNHAGTNAVAGFFSSTVYLVFLVSGYLCLLIIASRSREWAAAKLAIAVLALQTLLVHLIKLLTYHWLTRPTGSSEGFPSGHTAAVFALAYLLSTRFPRLTAVWFAIAAGIGWSRIVLAEHWLYQVLAGAFLGLLVAVLLIAQPPLVRRIAARYHLLLVAIIPLIALWYTQHEYENDRLLLTIAGFFILAGVLFGLRLLRVAAWDRRHYEYLAISLICIGVTIGSELVWLAPFTALTCLTVYKWAARADLPLQSDTEPVHRRHLLFRPEARPGLTALVMTLLLVLKELYR